MQKVEAGAIIIHLDLEITTVKEGRMTRVISYKIRATPLEYVEN